MRAVQKIPEIKQSGPLTSHNLPVPHVHGASRTMLALDVIIRNSAWTKPHRRANSSDKFCSGRHGNSGSAGGTGSGISFLRSASRHRVHARHGSTIFQEDE